MTPPEHLQLIAEEKRVLEIQVRGKPITQGSKVRNRFGGVRDDNAATLHPWRDNVRSAAIDALAGQLYPFGAAPCVAIIGFRFPRPAGHYGIGRNAQRVKTSAPRYPMPRGSDIDKLVRAIFDSLTDACVWHDDVQAVSLYTSKDWADSDHPPGADITITHKALEAPSSWRRIEDVHTTTHWEDQL